MTNPTLSPAAGQRRQALLAAATALALCAAPGLAGAQQRAGERPVPPAPALAKPEDAARSRSASLPAKGLFVGDKLSDTARKQLAELVVEAHSLDVQVALVVPSGPWQIDGSGSGERQLTPARLEAVRRYLAERGVDGKRIYVESRIDAKLKEPRLDVQLVGRPAGQN